jgi:hypothetical protein
MRSRLAVVSLLTLALAAIGTAQPANATVAPQQEFQRFPIPAGGSVVNLDSAPQFYVALSKPGVLRITSLEGHRLLVEVRAAPNPAGLPTASNSAERTPSTVATSFGSRIGFDPGNYLRASRVAPLAIPFPQSASLKRSRLSSGLRAAALVGTLVQGRHNRS